MEEYLTGKMLYGNDFNFEQIQQWYQDEKEGYADLGNKNPDEYRYAYHHLNQLHGFNYVGSNKFEHVLGVGSAWGHEFYPIIDRMTNLHIIEPSDHLKSSQIQHLTPIYTKPTTEGVIHYPDQYFDLVTCFSTLHHIPNVSFVLQELYRVTKPGGYILLREPIISMGDWRYPRKGLTKHERGIPLELFRTWLKQLNVEIVNETLYSCMTAFFERFLRKIFKKNRPIISHKSYVLFDKWLSQVFSWNFRYHATKKVERIAPSGVFYVLRKK